MGRGENDQDKKAKAHPYRRPEQKTKRSDHKNPSNDIVGSIITVHGWEEHFSWDTAILLQHNKWKDTVGET